MLDFIPDETLAEMRQLADQIGQLRVLRAELVAGANDARRELKTTLTPSEDGQPQYLRRTQLQRVVDATQQRLDEADRELEEKYFQLRSTFNVALNAARTVMISDYQRVSKQLQSLWSRIAASDVILDSTRLDPAWRRLHLPVKDGNPVEGDMIARGIRITEADFRKGLIELIGADPFTNPSSMDARKIA